MQRRFLVVSDAWKALADGVRQRKGYLSAGKEPTICVRTVAGLGTLTITGAEQGIGRGDFEYDIPIADATIMLDQLCGQPLIEKARFTIRIGPLTWEVDEFTGANRGLVLAEVELAAAGQRFECPAWVGQDVSSDDRYLEANLTHRPFTTWATL